MPTAAVTHLGCKLNQSEAEALSLAFARAGYDIVAPADGPDVFVLNSCTVTHVADRKSRQMLRRAKRRNPGSQIIATGCYAHRAPQELEAMAEVDLVVDNRGKMRLLDILGVQEADASAAPGGRRARSMVKIQEGCNQVCAYCIVPKTRGRERSLPIDEILDTMRARTDAGYREIVLTGTQLGSYGYEFGPPPTGRTWYEELVRRALDETGVTRLRFSSLQPQEITDGMIELYRVPAGSAPTSTSRSRAGATPSCDGCGADTTPGTSAAASSGYARRSPTSRSPPTSSSASPARPMRTSTPPPRSPRR